MRSFVFLPGLTFVLVAGCLFTSAFVGSPATPFHFELAPPLPFTLQSDESIARNPPESMAGGVAIFDYNGDGRPDLFFTNGAKLATLTKDSPRFYDHLLRNEGGGRFTDVTDTAGLRGHGFDVGAAVGDFDNDGRPDLFVAGVHGNTLYRNNGDGTFSDVTAKAGLDRDVDPDYGPLWAVAAAWVDVNNDGLLDLFVVNYVQWKYSTQPQCSYKDAPDYCHPRFFKPLPNQLFLNKGNGRFEDVSQSWGIRSHPGKGMGAGIADYDLDGKPDIFVTNDADYNALFHNAGTKFEESAFNAGVALPEDGNFISGMGLDFRDYNNDGLPDIAFIALNNQTIPVFQNMGKGEFHEVTSDLGIRQPSLTMAGFGVGFFDFDNDGWKDLFAARGHVAATEQPGTNIEQLNSIFRNSGSNGKWQVFTEEAGFNGAPPARHRGCAFGDLDGDGRIDIVVTALGRAPEIWMNRSAHSGHWLDIALEGVQSNRGGVGAVIKVVSSHGAQFNHMTGSVGYASSSYGPVHFGLGADQTADEIEIRWPSGIMQHLRNVHSDQLLQIREDQR